MTRPMLRLWSRRCAACSSSLLDAIAERIDAFFVGLVAAPKLPNRIARFVEQPGESKAALPRPMGQQRCKLLMLFEEALRSEHPAICLAVERHVGSAIFGEPSRRAAARSRRLYARGRRAQPPRSHRQAVEQPRQAATKPPTLRRSICRSSSLASFRSCWTCSCCLISATPCTCARPP